MAISVSLNGAIFEQAIYSKEDDFEQLVAKNAETIFGDRAIYIDTKRKIDTSSLGGTIPDGFLIDLSDPDDPQFYLVEVELQSHDFFRHIFPQITKFFAFYRDSKQRHKLIETIFALFQGDSAVTKKLRDSIGSKEIYKFLKDTIDNSQNILIIIDGPKAEFKEIMDTYTDTWGKMVKVQIVNHFRRDNNNILTVEPPFQNLVFEDAVSQSPDTEISEPPQYTEEFHLDGCSTNVKDIYDRLKNEFLQVKGDLIFKPIHWLIGVRDNSHWHPHRNNIARIYVRKKKLLVFCWLSESEAKQILESPHHNVKRGDSESCYLEICDTDHWDEIQKLVSKLIEKTSGNKKAK